MAKVIEGGFIKVDAEPWCEGKIVAGILKSVDTLPSKPGKEEMSRKIIFEVQPGKYAAVWETGYLSSQVKNMKAGRFYYIKCNGKTADTQYGVKAWTFDVLEAENAQDIKEFTAGYAKYVAGGGK